MPQDIDGIWKVGARGLVVHYGPRKTGTFHYYSDNAEDSWRKLEVDLDAFAEARNIDTSEVDLLLSASAPIALLTKADEDLESDRTFLVNVAAFGAADSTGTVPAPVVPDLTGDVFLIAEDSKYYAVSSSIMEPLKLAAAGEAKVLVRRGAIAAAVPNNEVPFGTNCLLVNLTQLVPDEGDLE